MPIVRFRNSLSNERREVDVPQGTTVREAAVATGMVGASDQFSVRDRAGELVDGDEVSRHTADILSIGIAGNKVSGG